MDYEVSLDIVPGWVNFSISRTAPDGFWHRLERGDIPLDQTFFDGFSQDLHDSGRWETFYRREQANHPGLDKDIPPLPAIDAEFLFDAMMTGSSQPDPWMYPALKNLHESGTYILAALSNTVIFPPGHKLHTRSYRDNPLRGLFDVFVSSAHIGLRKPDPKIYGYALRQVDTFAKEHAGTPRGQGLAWDAGVRPQDIVFLDDIGENLRTARNLGFGTIKVPLGRAYEAVEQLEQVTGLTLAGDHPRIPDKPQARFRKAKI